MRAYRECSALANVHIPIHKRAGMKVAAEAFVTTKASRAPFTEEQIRKTW